MSKTITLRLSDEKYKIYKLLAERDNRPISNFIDTAVNKFIIALGRSRQGIDFYSVDKQPVNLVFLMGIPNENIKGYLKVLAYLTRLLKKDDFRKQLLDAHDPQEMIEIFNRVQH